ncbi:MAG: putative N-acetyltransferase YjcF [Pelotomaculum sp. PtaB.Bin104]|nr:MAG: putative N-acetyltransferase YjcF [Pelotomaculum sp. PtaB.Bin104]
MILSRWVHGTKDFDAVRALRTAVFVGEQGIDEAVEFDGFDQYAMHVVAYNGDQPAGTGRLYFDGEAFRIGRICVRKEMRGQKIGDMIVRLLLDRALNVNAPRIRVHACPALCTFYGKFGFVATGEPFVEDDREVIPMEVLAKDVLFPRACGCNDNSGGK